MVLIAFHYSSTISIIRLLIIITISLRLEVKINCATIEVAKIHNSSLWIDLVFVVSTD